MNADEREARVLWSGCLSMGPVRFRRLEEAFGSGAAALEAGPEAWRSVEGVGPAADALAKELKAARARRAAEAAEMAKAGARTVLPDDPGYPAGLKSLDDRPFILYMKGEWGPVDDLSVALVGSRKPTAYGRAAAERLARELAEAGVTVVSGLARGVDSAAHEAALKRGGRTAGILGSGFGRFYPPENKALAARIAERGAVVTEHPWSTEPLAFHFPMRNRVISGASLATVVVEADLKSGALITARLAAAQGREVGAVPGPIFSPLSRGPNLLLKEGARPVEGAEDVIEALEVFRRLAGPKAARRAPAPALPPAEAALLKKVSLEPAGADALSQGAGMAPGTFAAALLGLEMKGLIKALPGRFYVRSEEALKG